MTTEPPRLALHVFGAGKGESIVVRLPDGRWGVVDCFAGSSAHPPSNPVLRFLRDQGVRELEFLGLTHPHDDHYKGMSHLLEAFPVRYFWSIAGMSGNWFRQLVEYHRFDAAELDQLDEIENAEEFGRIFALVERRRKRQDPPLRQKVPAPTAQLYPVPFDSTAGLQIIGLAPSGDQVAHYQRGFARCFNERGEIRERLPHAHHNIISSALLICYGRTRIVLGGDVEREGWLDVLHDLEPDLLAATAVKVSHHGSTNGYCEGLWETFARRGRPIGIVTAYASQRLPRRAALEEIIRHTSQLLTTCTTALNQEELPDTLDVGLLRSRLALQVKMGGLIDERRHECGRCSLLFDDEGNCTEMMFVPPADRLTAAS